MYKALTSAVLIAFLSASDLPLNAAGTGTTTSTAVPPPKPSTGGTVFHLPQVATPVLPIRDNEGTRGTASEGIKLTALVPGSLVFTADPQPSLYWYQSGMSKFPCQITITEHNNSKPLLVLKSAPGTPPGIHVLRLSKLTTKLAPDTLYVWSVAIIADSQNHSEDLIANGLVEYKQPVPDLQAKLQTATDADKINLYNLNGYWYDELRSISESIERAPQNADLRSSRANLLKQVGLDGDAIERSAFPAPVGKNLTSKP